MCIRISVHCAVRAIRKYIIITTGGEVKPGEQSQVQRQEYSQEYSQEKQNLLGLFEL